ncbi:MAG: hypothetical protein HY056_15615 [Proteobacteria bacterium]|nr:hypothetical protein [Pseudomonadota bacterium]
MSSISWRPVGNVLPEEFRAARHNVHNVAQWLARMAHSYMVRQPGHRHTLLRWDGQRQALVTQEFLPRLTLELRLPGLALQFREDRQVVPHVIETDGRTSAEVEAWVLVELLHRRLDRDRFAMTLPFEIPALMTGDAVPYLAKPFSDAHGVLAAWIANAAAVLERVAVDERAVEFGAFPGTAAWCWPQILDLAILLPAPDDKTGGGNFLRAGLSLGNAEHDGPHFYLARHNPEALANYSHAQVLTATALLSHARPADCVLEFLREGIAAARRRAAN